MPESRPTAEEAPEVHNVGERLDLEALPGEGGATSWREPSVPVRVGGHVLLWTIAVVVCYSAAL